MSVLLKKSAVDQLKSGKVFKSASVVIGGSPKDELAAAPKTMTKAEAAQIIAKATASSGLQSTALDRERVFDALYAGDGASGALKPPYDPDLLFQLVETNNTLQPCIDAMITNIDGTGWEIVPPDNATADVPEQLKTKLEGFFKQVWPGVSFMTLRKALRRDLEVTGNAYMEVIRNQLGEVALLRRMDPTITRMMRYDDMTFDEKVFSAALNTEVTVQMRRRRYVQFSFGKLVYFKEFGSSAQLDRVTGQWQGQIVQGYDSAGNYQSSDSGEAPAAAYSNNEAAGSYVPKGNTGPFKPANEVLHFTCIVHHEVPYGIPRWVMQTPSVVGSRKAEEFNVGFFDAGGIPPLLILVQGGQTAEDVESALKNMFYSKGPHKNIAAILQVEGTEGSLDKPGNVRVTVERFGSERQKDAMFDIYDKSCSDKLRRAFRLPGLFIGNTENFNYATALASYRVAEAQVFEPERAHFDEIINSTLVSALLDVESGQPLPALFRSMSIQARDVDQQLQAVLEAGKAGWIDPDEAVADLNEVTNLDMTVSAEPGKFLPPLQVAGLQQETSMQQMASLGTIGNTSKVAKREFDVLDLMVAAAAQVIKSRRRGSQQAFDCVDFMDKLDPMRKELFGIRLGKSVYACEESEQVAAARVAIAALRDAAQ